MLYNNFNGATHKQIEAVLLIVPGPEGEGLIYDEASKKLGICKSAFIKRIKSFKTKHLEAWDEVQSMWRAARRQRKSLESPMSLEDVDVDMAVDENKIEDVF